MIERLIDHAAAKRAVAYDRHGKILGAFDGVRRGYARRLRNGGARMTLIEAVVLAFVGPDEAGKTALAPQSGEPLRPAREQLMGIRLMADIPNYLVGGRIEALVKSDGKLHRAEI